MLASIAKQTRDLEENQKTLRTQIYAKISERLTSVLGSAEKTTSSPDSSTLPAPASNSPTPQLMTKKTFNEKRKQLANMAKIGSTLRVTYNPLFAAKHPPTASELTLPMLMAAQTHLGHATSLWNPRNSSYIFGIRDGIHIISLDVTYAYLRRAARVVQEVARRGGIILFVGTRDKQEEIVVQAARTARGYHIFNRWVPGSLTNGQQILGNCRLKVVDLKDQELPEHSALLGGPSGHPFMKPDLVVCLNPLENHVCLQECGLHTVPTIGVIDTDADASWVTYPIPANDDSIRAITLIAGVLAHAGAEGQRVRLEAAELGRATYSTAIAQRALQALEEMNSLRVQPRERESADD